MVLFDNKLMKGHSFALILTFLSIVGSIYGQKSSEFDDYDYGEDIGYESEDMSLEDKTVGPSEKIGELEFDIEVAEQTPGFHQMAPEELVVDDVSISLLFQ